MSTYDKMVSLFIWLFCMGICLLLVLILSGNVHSDTLTISDVTMYDDSDAVMYYPWEFGLFVGYSTEAITIDPEYDVDGELDYLDTISGATEFIIHSQGRVQASQDSGSDDVEVYMDFRYGYSEGELLSAGWSNQFRNDYTVSNPTALDATYSMRLRLEAVLYEDLLVQTRWCLRWTSLGSVSETCETSKWVVLNPGNQPTPTPTVTVAPGSTNTNTPTPSWTPTSTDTPTSTNTPTNTPTATDTPVTPYTNTPTPTATNTPTPTRHIEAWYDDHRIEDPFRHDLIEWQDQNVLPETVPSPGTVLRVNSKIYMVDEDGAYKRFRFAGDSDDISDSELLGDGSTTLIEVSHGLSTNLIAQARETFADYRYQYVKISYPNDDTIYYHYPSPIQPNTHTSIYQESDYFKTVGNASDTEFTVTHNLGTEKIVVQARDYNGQDVALLAVVRVVDTNSIVVDFGKVHGTNEAAVNVIAAATSMVIGNAADTVLYVTHSYNTRNILVSVFETSGDQKIVYPQIAYDTNSRMRFTFGAVPGAGEYTVNMQPVRPITWEQMNQQFVRLDNSNIETADALGHYGMNFFAKGIRLSTSWIFIKSNFDHVIRTDGNLELDTTNGGRAGGHIVARNYMEFPDQVGKKLDLALDIYKVDVSNDDFDLYTDKNFKFHSKDYGEVIHFDEVGNATFNGVATDILNASVQAVESASDTFVRIDGSTDITGEQKFTNDGGYVNFNDYITLKKIGLSTIGFTDIGLSNFIWDFSGLGTDDTTISSDGIIVTNDGNSNQWGAAYSWGNHAVAGYLINTQVFNFIGDMTGSGEVSTNIRMSLNVDSVTGDVIDFTDVTLLDFTNDAGYFDASSDVDHGGVGGLADDDHEQYLLVDGSRPMTADLNMASFAIVSATSISSGTITLSTVAQLVFNPSSKEQIILYKLNDSVKSTVSTNTNDIDWYTFNSYAWSTAAQADALLLNTLGDLSTAGDVNVGDELQAKSGETVVVDATFDFAAGHGLTDVSTLNFTSGNSTKMRLSGDTFTVGVSDGNDMDFSTSLGYTFSTGVGADKFTINSAGDAHSEGIISTSEAFYLADGSPNYLHLVPQTGGVEFKSHGDISLDPNYDGLSSGYKILASTMIDFEEFLGPKIQFFGTAYQIEVTANTLEIESDRMIELNSDERGIAKFYDPGIYSTVFETYNDSDVAVFNVDNVGGVDATSMLFDFAVADLEIVGTTGPIVDIGGFASYAVEVIIDNTTRSYIRLYQGVTLP